MDVEQVLVVPTPLFHEAGLFQGLSRAWIITCRVCSIRAICRIVPGLKSRSIQPSSKSFPTSSSSMATRFSIICVARAPGEKRLRACVRSASAATSTPATAAPTLTAKVCCVKLKKKSTWACLQGKLSRAHQRRQHPRRPSSPRHRARIRTGNAQRAPPRKRPHEAGFAPIADLCKRKEEFETWSRIVLETLMIADCGRGNLSMKIPNAEQSRHHGG